MTETQRDQTVENLATHRIARTVAEEPQQFPITQALAEKMSTLSATIATLDESRLGLGEQERMARCAQACSRHRGKDNPCYVRRFALFIF